MSNSPKMNIAFFAAECSSNEEKNALHGITEEAKSLDINVLIFNALKNFTRDDQLTLDTNIFGLADFSSFSGVIIGQNLMAGYKDIGDSLIKKCQAHNVPVISMGMQVEGCKSYVFSNSSCLEQIVDHLIEDHNCRTFNLMAGIKGNLFSDQREEAFRDSLKKHGIEVDERRIGYGNFWEGSTKEALKKFFDSNLPLPDAFVCCNDIMAMTVCGELKKRGYLVPDDVLVTGYDGIEIERYHSPRITTAKCDTFQLGKNVIHSLLDLINGKDIPDCQVMDATLIFNESCGCKKAYVRNTTNYAFEVMQTVGDLRYTNEVLHHFETLTSEVEKLEDVKKVLSKQVYFGGNYWIMVNQDFMDIKKQLKYTREEPFSETMACFLVSRNFTLQNDESIPKSQYLPNLQEVLDENENAIVFMDLYFSNESIGYMAVPFSGTDLRAPLMSAELLAQTLSQNLSLLRGREKLQYVNYHDLMTNIYNRRGFYHNFTAEIKKRINTNSFLVLHSIDMDNLKTINDTFGHKEGDFAIISLAKAIMAAGNESLIAARFGGDEFVAAEFADSDPEKTVSDFRENLQNQLNEINLNSGKPFKVSCSCGSHSTIFPEDMQVDQIIAKADELMYSEKSTKKRSSSRI